jgi:hypothetical protein
MDNRSIETHFSDRGLAPFNRGVIQDLTKIVSFMREDQDHIVFKRFERLNLYNLLLLQHRMTVLEKDVAVHEKNQDVQALAKVLLSLEHLAKSYRMSPHFPQLSETNWLLDDALLAQDQIGRLHATPQHLVLNLKAHSEHDLIELKHELDPEAGWSELVSPATRPKGWIHRLVDRHYRLQKLFDKVCTFLIFKVLLL